MVTIVDSDSHLFELPDLWADHADPAKRHLALTMDRDENGWDWVSFQGRKILECWFSTPGDFRTLGPTLERCRQGLPCEFDYARDLPEHYWAPGPRAAALADLGVDETILFPHWGLNWGLALRGEPEARLVNMEAWNRWAAQVRVEGRGALHPVGHLELLDLEWLERQLRALSAAGVKLGWIPAGLVEGVRPSHPELDRAWSLFDEYGVNPVFHVGANPVRPFQDGWYEGHHSHYVPLLSFPLLGMDVFVTLLDLVLNGVLERHPSLRFGVLEVMTDWFPMLLRRLDTTPYSELAITGRSSLSLSLTPSEYVRRSVRISSFASEKPGRTIEQVGPLVMWSADYPHAEGEPSVEVYRAKAGPIPDDAADAFWGANAEFLLGR
ncbi:MAG: amidohydrolase family protein [Acidimicrobiales bacterium]